MLVKEFLQLFRDPRMRMIILGMPLLQMLVLSFALTNDVTDIKTAILDFDRTPSSRELAEEFTSSGYFEIVEYAESQSDIQRILDRGRARVVIHIPAGFEGDLQSGRTGQVQVIADGTDSNSTAIVFGYSNLIIGNYTQRKIAERIDSYGAAGIEIGEVGIQTRAWYNPNLESKYFYVPALVGLMLVVVSMVLTSIAIVKEREIGTIEQVMVTPITRTEFIIGKTLPYMIICYVLMTIMFILARVVFGIPIKGGIFLLYILAGIYLLGNLGLALLISVSANTQQQALLTAFFFMMPAVLLSGFLFPIHNMPVTVQYLTYLNPMRWFLEILSGIVMKGVGLESIWQAALGQSVLAVLFLTLAVSRFRKTMS